MMMTTIELTDEQAVRLDGMRHERDRLAQELGVITLAWQSEVRRVEQMVRQNEKEEFEIVGRILTDHGHDITQGAWNRIGKRIVRK